MKIMPLLLLALCLCSCTNSRSSSVRAQEIEAIAWLVEDCCHGIKRNPGELVNEHCSLGQLQVASWLANGDLSVEHNRYPLHIHKRQQQWIIVKQGLHAGHIISTNSGYLALQENLSADVRAIFEETVIQENQLRSSTDRLVLQQAGLEARSQLSISMLQALATARITLDRQVINND